jgi:hypothetical protein
MRTSRADLDAVTVRVNDDALIVAITGTSGPVNHRDPVRPEALRQGIHKVVGTYRNRQMRQTQPLRAGSDFDQRQRRRGHRFETSSVVETKEARLESLRSVLIMGAGDGPKVGGLEVLATTEVGSPYGNVFYMHGCSPEARLVHATSLFPQRSRGSRGPVKLLILNELVGN